MKNKKKKDIMSIKLVLKTLGKSVREYKKSSLLAPTFVALEVLLEVLIPFTISFLIDEGVNAGNMRYILLFGGALLGSALVSLLFGVLSGKNAAVAAAGFASNLRKDMYYNIQRFSFANIDKFSSASLITRMTKDVVSLQETYQICIRIAIRAPFMLVFAMIMAFSVNAKIAVIFLAVLPIMVIALFILMKFVHPLFEKMFKKYDDLNNVVEENLQGMRVVKSYNREDFETKKFKKSSSEIYYYSVKAEKIMAGANPLMMICIYGSMLFINWFAAQIIVKSGGTEMTTGQLTSLISYVMQIMMSVLFLSMVIVFMTISRAAAERVTEVLMEEPTITNGENPVYEVADGSIDFENVSFRYSETAERNALDNVDLHIRSGETIGVLGSTGSSKSTLVQLISRLYDASEGVVKVGGVNVRDYDLETLRDNVAMVLQKNVLFAGTIKENLRWGNPNATDEELVEACRLAQADGFIRTFPDGYDTRLEQGGSNVSGGQKQRLCIARSLLKKPKVLILDDSTSAVDTKTDAAIRAGFRSVIPGVTKIIIAQRVASVMDADRIIVMEGGAVNAVGTHEELLASNEIYREVYESQISEGGAK